MRSARRNNFEAKPDFIPLIDVIFVLLTFFIYSVITMVQADILPVRLTRLTSGSSATGQLVHAITIDAAGKLYYNRQAIDEKQLDETLQTLAKDPAKPRLYLAMEDQGTTDRGPMLLQIVGRAKAAGVEDFALVGPPASTVTKPRETR